MESPLEVLSRAVCMVQDNANESRLTTKELPTTKWRRDRRLRATASDYHQQRTSSPVGSPSSNPQSPKPLTESTNTNCGNNGGLSSSIIADCSTASYECPIDMSVTSTTIKTMRNSPPPPYREPLPGSTYATTALARPSVITQAPPKRNTLHNHHSLISNRENDNSNSETNSIGEPPVIDEQSVDDHFAKALGDTWKKLKAADNKNVENLSIKKITSSAGQQPPAIKKSLIANSSLVVVGPTSSSSSSSPPPQPTAVKPKSKTKSSPPPPQTLPVIPPPTQQRQQQQQQKKSLNSGVSMSLAATTNQIDSVSHSVDDHFAKALGDTWKKLQADKIARNDED